MSDLDEVLSARGDTYGSFSDVSATAQAFKKLFFQIHLNKYGYSDAQREALDMIFSKLARIKHGDPNYADSWVDIAGYATLVVDTLQKSNK